MIRFPEYFPQVAAELFARNHTHPEGVPKVLRMHFGCHTITRRGEDFFIEPADAATCAEPRVAAVPPTVFLPFFGEFGFLIASHIRAVHACKSPRKIVFCERGQECLFPTASEFRYDWQNPLPDRLRGARLPADFEQQKSAELSRIAGLFPGSKSINSPHSWDLVGKVKFCPSAPHFLPPVDVAISARQRLHHPIRNFQHWQRIVGSLRAKGLRVAVVGEQSTTAKVDVDVRAWEHPQGATAGTVDILSHCKLYVGTDTGTSHLAALMDVPSIIIHHQDKGRIAEMQQSTRAYFQHLQNTAWTNPAMVETAISGFFTKSTTEGVVILSTGKRRRDLLANAAGSVARIAPNLGLHLVTDTALRGYDCRIVTANTGNSSRAHKTQLLTHSPFERGVIIDDDALLLRDFGRIEEILGEADLAMAVDCNSKIGPLLRSQYPHHLAWLSRREAAFTLETFGDCDTASHYNSGVIFFRRSQAVIELAKVWHEEWKRFRGVDQIALFRAIRRTGIAVTHLPPALHYRLGMKARPENPAIVHFLGTKWKAREWMEARGIPYISEIAPVATLAAQPRATLHFRGNKTYRVVDGVSELLPARPRPSASPEVWGPPAWARLHAWAASCPRDPVARRRWLADFVASLPQCDCKSHWWAMLAKTPPPLTGSAEELYGWTLDRHNEVNARLGKPHYLPKSINRADTRDCTSGGKQSAEND